MKWIDVSEEFPTVCPWPNKRYLIKTKCSHFAHTSLAALWPTVCNGVNIAYYCGYGEWLYDSSNEWDKDIKVTHWMPLPQEPNTKCGE